MEEFDKEDLEFYFKDQFRLNLLHRFSMQSVENKRLCSIHARGSSRKEVVDNNKQLIIFLIFEDNLYTYSQIP